MPPILFTSPLPLSFPSTAASHPHLQAPHTKRRPPRPHITLCHPTQPATPSTPSPPTTVAPIASPPPAATTTSPPNAPTIQTESLNLLEWPQISAQVLRHANTPQGRAALTTPTGLPIPSTRAASERLLSHTRQLHHLSYTLGLPLPLSNIADVTPHALRAAKGGVLTGPQLLEIAHTLSAARRLRRHVDAAATAHPSSIPLLKALVATLRTRPEAEHAITAALDDYGDVTDAADPALRELRISMRSTFSDVREKLNALMSQHASAMQERVITTRNNRYVLPVKTTHKSVFRRSILHDLSATGATSFLEPAAIRPLNDRLRALTAQEAARVQAVLRALSVDIVAPIVPDLLALNDVIATLDAASARAAASYELQAVDVVFDDARPLRLLGARHPLLSWAAMRATTSPPPTADINSPPSAEGNISSRAPRFKPVETPAWMRAVVPSSYMLGPDVRCVCVTGPNTGGKTLALKTLGACVLMAKAGLFVPASARSVFDADNEADDEASERTGGVGEDDGTQDGREDNGDGEKEGDWDGDEAGRKRRSAVARLPYFDNILADIGDDQSLVQSLSTFSGHVQRIKRILAASTARSLVLLDEIGSGTDPAEGAALGMAIVRHLAIEQKAALTFCTTHHGELKTLKYAGDDSANYFENASVEFDDVRMAPTFKLVWGIPGRSNALAIASRLGLRASVVDEANFLLRGSGGDGDGATHRVDIEKMIRSLEREKTNAEVAREQAENALQEIEALRAELRERVGRLRVSEQSLREDQRAAMDSELKTARKQIAKVIKEMQQGGGSAQAASKASDKLSGICVPSTAAGNKSSNGDYKVSVSAEDSSGVQVGDKVIVPRFGASTLDVVAVVSKKEILVAVGSMKAKVKVKEISSISRPNPIVQEAIDRAQTQRNSESTQKQMMVRTAANSIDIRGQRVDEAEGKVDQAIDKALALGTIWVIHGHGSGRLRAGIREFLSNHAQVERIENAEQSEGGNGVTIAFLL